MFPDFHGWLILIRTQWLSTLEWMAGLAIGFALLARWMPCNPGMFWWKDMRAFATDAVYWFIVPLFLRIGRTLMLILGVALLFQGHAPQPFAVQLLPLWQQCLLVLILQDILLYALHRVFHTRLGWGFHAVHHSPKVLDWMATVRFHPLNNLLSFGLADVTVLLLGFSPNTLILLAPFNIAYSALVHANLNWTFGPLRYVLASPVFHRWHHTTEREGLNKNFASTFPILDLLFGTFYLPVGKLPEHFGNDEPDFPSGFWGQLVYPVWNNQVTSLGARVRRWPAVAVLVLMAVLGAGLVMGRSMFQPTRRDDRMAPREATTEQLCPAQLTQAPPCPNRPRSTAVHTVAISADGRRIVSGGEDGAVKVWDGEGRLLHTLTGHQRTVRGVAISRDGRWIVSGSHDCTLKIWDANSGEEIRTLGGHAAGVLAVALSADGSFLVSGSGDSTVRLWDAQAGEERKVLPGPGGPVLGVALSGDGRRIATTSGPRVTLWDVERGRSLFSLEGHTDYVYSVALNADGSRLISGSRDGTAIVWDTVRRRAQSTFRGHNVPIYAVALSPDAHLAVSGGADGIVRTWSTATGKEVQSFSGHRGDVTCVAMTDRRIVSGGRDGSVKIWSIPAPEPDKLTRR